MIGHLLISYTSFQFFLFSINDAKVQKGVDVFAFNPFGFFPLNYEILGLDCK